MGTVVHYTSPSWSRIGPLYLLALVQGYHLIHALKLKRFPWPSYSQIQFTLYAGFFFTVIPEWMMILWYFPSKTGTVGRYARGRGHVWGCIYVMTLRYEGLPGTATYILIGNIDRQTALWLDTRLHVQQASQQIAVLYLEKHIAQTAALWNCGTVNDNMFAPIVTCSPIPSQKDVMSLRSAVICSTLSRNLCGQEIPRKSSIL